MAVGASATVVAGPVFSFADGTHAAQATFEQDGSTLRLTLENTSVFDVMAPEDVLTGVFFDLSNFDANLTPLRAFLTGDNSVLFAESGDGTDVNGEIGGEYAFRDNLLDSLAGGSMVIGAVGLGDLLGPPHLFPGANLSGPPSGSPAGIGYGILSAFDDPTTGNWPVTGKSPLISNGIVFELGGLPDDFVLNGQVGDVRFNYGSDFNPIPTPSTLLLISVGVAMVSARRRKRRPNPAHSST